MQNWYWWLHLGTAIVSFGWSMRQYKEAGFTNPVARCVGSIGVAILGPLGLYINWRWR